MRCMQRKNQNANTSHGLFYRIFYETKLTIYKEKWGISIVSKSLRAILAPKH